MQTEPEVVTPPAQTVVVAATLNPRIPMPEKCPEYESLLASYQWDVNTARALMKTESGCNPARDNAGLNSDGTNDVGLMQINSIHVASGLISEEARRDPKANMDAAYALYRGAGYKWTPWSAYNSGDYLKNL